MPSQGEELELKGWPYPRHLAGRVFSVVVHGDAAGAENLRRILSDWMSDIEDDPIRPPGDVIDRYVGYLAALRHQPRRLRSRRRSSKRCPQCGAHAGAERSRTRRSGKLQPPDRGLHEAAPEITDATPRAHRSTLKAERDETPRQFFDNERRALACAINHVAEAAGSKQKYRGQTMKHCCAFGLTGGARTDSVRREGAEQPA